MYNTTALISEDKNDFIVICPKCGQEYHLDSIDDMTVAECEVCDAQFVIRRPYGWFANENVEKEIKPKTYSYTLNENISSNKCISIGFGLQEKQKPQEKCVNDLKVEEELKKIKKDTSVVAFVCWPIAISMILGFIGLLFKGLIIIGAAAGSGDGFVAILVVGFFGLALIAVCVFGGAFDDEENENENILENAKNLQNVAENPTTAAFSLIR